MALGPGWAARAQRWLIAVAPRLPLLALTGACSSLAPATGTEAGAAQPRPTEAGAETGNLVDAGQQPLTEAGHLVDAAQQPPTEAGHLVDAAQEPPTEAGNDATRPPETLVKALMPDTSAIAVDATSVYWAGPRGVMKVAKSGGTAVALVATNSTPSAIAVDSTSVYYAADGSVFSVPVGGGRPATLASTATNALAVDALDVYWVDNRGFIMKISVGGGIPTQISKSPGYPSRLTIDSKSAYWADLTGLMTAPLDGGPATYLWMHGLSWTSLVATQAGEVYFTNGTLDAGALFGIAASGATLRQLAVGQRLSGLAADEANVYWADRARNTVEYVPRSGGPAVPLSSTEDQPDAIALDAQYVYWIDIGGAVMRMRKP